VYTRGQMTKHRTPLVVVTLTLATLTLAGKDARAADEVAVCIKSFDQGQDSRDQSRLLEARESFLVCARDVCPQQIRTACSDALTALSPRIPTLVVAVKDLSGHDITVGRLLVDKKPVEGALQGTAFTVNPGPHTLRVEHPGTEPFESQVVAREGEQRRIVQVTLKTGVAESISKPAPPMATEKSSSGGGPPTSTWIAGGLGVGFLAVSIGFGVSGLGAYSDLKKCRDNAACTDYNDQASKTKSQLLLSDVFGGLAVVSFGTAALFWILAPSANTEKAGSIAFNLGPSNASARIRF
jgi:hypothetical protein